ncbi:MAG: hypothetical protein EHM28_11150 [Spirochaetaceae bacterium]|nr:MAG: hypothetical protein EHM28_11150 [Spirochaetaceae bacterium]
MRTKALLLSAVLLLPLLGCQTTGNTREGKFQLVFERDYYEDDKIRVDYVLGSEIFYISIYNKTGTEALLDAPKLVLVSYKGEIVPIEPDSKNAVLPPLAKAVFSSRSPSIKDTYTDAMSPVIDSHDIEQYKQLIGKRLRIYFSLFINNSSQIYNIELRIKDVISLKYRPLDWK